MTRTVASVLAGLALVLPARAADQVSLKKVKYDELTKFIKAQKGKVVVLDVWATY
ncbi:MAG TPA: hypothetical protein VKD72_01010 [Gemmataceae bacterium]|nr:hypothetical protein [Gemmataceae bacterium]